MELTNEAEPYFMHILEVSEEDFQSLKAEQGLVVDFTSFPEKIASLLERCISARSDPSHRQTFAEILAKIHQQSIIGTNDAVCL